MTRARSRRRIGNTRQTYGKGLDKMERAIGKTEIAAVTLADVKRRYAVARYPRGKRRDKLDQVRTVHGFASMLRRIVSFGMRSK